ncbi:MAG: ATP-grasp domain-containing protein [Gaiellaceae bacterium]
MATFLFLGASVSQLAALRQARTSGHTVVAVDGDPNAVGFAEADIVESVDFSDVDAVTDVGRRHDVDGVVAISTDRAVPVAAAVAERLGLPGIGVETAAVMTDKGAMRTRLCEHGVPQPPFAVVGSLDDARAAIAAVGLPAVLKPVDSGGQRGLHRIDSYAELRTQLPDALDHSRSGRAIIERYVDGAELNAILVVRDGEARLLTLSDRLRPPGVGFGVGWIHLFPSRLPEALREAAARAAVASVSALGLQNGIAFPQLLVDDDGEVAVVEVAARIPAGQMADVVQFGVGVDLVEIALLQALGEPVPDELVAPRRRRPLAVRFLTAEPGVLPTGRVVAVDGLDAVRAAPGVLAAGLYIQPGEIIHPVQVDADRRGYVIATGADTNLALDRAQHAAELLSVTVEAASVTMTR